MLGKLGAALGKNAWTKLGGSTLGGGGIGGSLGGVFSQFDGEDGDTFQDSVEGFGFGALGGLIGGGGILGGAALKGMSGKAKALSTPAYLGGGLGGLMTFTSPIGNALDAGDSPAGPQSPLGASLSPSGALGGSQTIGARAGVSQGIPDFLTGADPTLDLGAMPTLASMMNDPNVQKAANAQVIQANAATMREIAGIKKRRDLELQQQTNLSGEYQRRADEIQEGNVASTKAIQNHAADQQQRIDEETNAMHEATGAALAGNDHTRAEHAAAMDAQADRLNEARVADSKLLERLGIGGQTVLQDLAVAEQLDTTNKLSGIRAEAADTIDEKNTETADRWRFDKPVLQQQIAQEQLKTQMAARQMALSEWQQKMAAAGARRQDMLSYLTSQQQLQQQQYQTEMQYGGQGSELIPAEKLYGSSGTTFKNPADDSTQTIPMYVKLPEEVIAQNYPHLLADRQAWIEAYAASQGQ